MRASLIRWMRDADALRHVDYFAVAQGTLNLGHLQSRPDDYYLSLVGELFDRLREDDGDAVAWARLGNALAQFALPDQESLFRTARVSRSDAALFGAAAFYCGGFPASAYLTIRLVNVPERDHDVAQGCFDLLGRPTAMRSQVGNALMTALRQGNLGEIAAIAERASTAASAALEIGANEWIAARLLEQLVLRFLATNLRAVLPRGDDEFWTPLVSSFLDRTPPAWEFFPSQIQAISQGLLDRPETFSLQMPTGAGKTALCETLLYSHARRPDETVSVLLVPYRSLASELRSTLVRRLNSMNISARCAYGGTVPSGDEVRDLDAVRVMVATPEALSGVLGADPEFFKRISLVICDEGHLLDGVGRGVSLELLLARMRARADGGPRLVFVSAIVPNIEEIHSWLGGTPDTVVRSDYRPALAEFAVLRPVGAAASATIGLEMHPQEAEPVRYTIARFLSRDDFRWTNPLTGRGNTYGFGTVKAQAIATARKSLTMGATAVFAANKRGNQGAVGLAEELLTQLRLGLPLPVPAQFVDHSRVDPAVAYLSAEYGADWVGTQSLESGAVVHHGAIPQETREVLEALLRHGDLRFAICTTTLAEGVNLPIRTLVLYSVQRRGPTGRAENLLARDIKNLVGRAGRAGATTKGLVICANPEQWHTVAQVARQADGEPVTGALRRLVEGLSRALATQNANLTNETLEATPWLYSLIDGIDSTLIDLAAEEVGEEQLVQLATQLADRTFASRQARLESSRNLLRQVFSLRARRVIGVRSAGRLDWIRDTGSRVRLLDTVEVNLMSRREAWDDIADATDRVLVNIMLEWAWTHRDLQLSVREAYRLEGDTPTDSVRQSFFDLVTAWLSGARFVEIARIARLTVDDMLDVHTNVVAFGLQTVVEQGIALLERLLNSQGRAISAAVNQFPEHLRFGVPTLAGRALAARGLRHRQAFVELGNSLAGRIIPEDRATLFPMVRQLIADDADDWRARLGTLVFENTIRDLS
jgi:superfamily II DNA/RNA helicase